MPIVVADVPLCGDVLLHAPDVRNWIVDGRPSTSVVHMVKQVRELFGLRGGYSTQARMACQWSEEAQQLLRDLMAKKITIKQWKSQLAIEDAARPLVPALMDAQAPPPSPILK